MTTSTWLCLCFSEVLTKENNKSLTQHKSNIKYLFYENRDNVFFLKWPWNKDKNMVKRGLKLKYTKDKSCENVLYTVGYQCLIFHCNSLGAVFNINNDIVKG